MEVSSFLAELLRSDCFQHTVMACLLLASKIEEAPRRPREVVNVYNRLKQLHMRRYSSNPNKK